MLCFPNFKFRYDSIAFTVSKLYHLGAYSSQNIIIKVDGGRPQRPLPHLAAWVCVSVHACTGRRRTLPFVNAHIEHTHYNGVVHIPHGNTRCRSVTHENYEIWISWLAYDEVPYGPTHDREQNLPAKIKKKI